ncbi:MAG: AbrB/MazE/SpoVT family DNA-binding domain-containing protein [Rhizobiaceae bacterium]|jgi:AbrB family looped-hinge helix DNA binding protein
MSVLQITSKNQITLKRDVLRKLGLKSGDKVSVEVTEDGKAVLSPLKSRNDLDHLFGMFHDPDQPPMSIEEMNEIIADGWAGKR